MHEGVADEPQGKHTPMRPIRIDDHLWERLGEVYGPRARSTVIRQCAAYLLREPGAKLPPRAPAPGPSTD